METSKLYPSAFEYIQPSEEQLAMIYFYRAKFNELVWEFLKFEDSTYKQEAVKNLQQSFLWIKQAITHTTSGGSKPDISGWLPHSRIPPYTESVFSNSHTQSSDKNHRYHNNDTINNIIASNHHNYYSQIEQNDDRGSYNHSNPSSDCGDI